MWWQAYVLLVDGGQARHGKGSTELSCGTVEICGRCVWLQRSMMNGVLVELLSPSFVFDQELKICFSFKAVMSLTRMIG